jgi:3-methyladenine DNA glycosylase/8-oxoguanine DNA glycosylase
VIDPVVDLRTTLAVFRHGSHDPTTRLTGHDFWRATLTPDGPGTVHLWWCGDQLDADAWGPGAEWLLNRIPSMLGANDNGYVPGDDDHPAVRAAHRNHRGLRVGASGMLYHELLPIILTQRVTSGEALRQWRLVCRRLADPAPGPDPSLLLPPSPERILGRPAWWFHPLGVESKRAEALRTVARYAARINEWSTLPSNDAALKLQLLRGIGPWTIGSVLGPAFGDPDAVPVGDYHIPHAITWALAGLARGTDERMLELLEPYRGQRGRVIRLLLLDGHAAPAFGPRQRILPMHRW